MIPIALLIPLVCGTHVQAVVNYCEVIATKKLSNAFKDIKMCACVSQHFPEATSVNIVLLVCLCGCHISYYKCKIMIKALPIFLLWSRVYSIMIPFLNFCFILWSCSLEGLCCKNLHFHTLACL